MNKIPPPVDEVITYNLATGIKLSSSLDAIKERERDE